jgi:hypothetical protein
LAISSGLSKAMSNRIERRGSSSSLVAMPYYTIHFPLHGQEQSVKWPSWGRAGNKTWHMIQDSSRNQKISRVVDKIGFMTRNSFKNQKMSPRPRVPRMALGWPFSL